MSDEDRSLNMEGTSLLPELHRLLFTTKHYYWLSLPFIKIILS